MFPIEIIGRRSVLKRGVRLCVGLTFAPSLAFGQDDPKSSRPKEGDLLVRLNDHGMRPLTPEDIVVGALQTIAWPLDPAGNIVRNGSRLNQVLLLRLDPETLRPETRSRAAKGVVAYTAICTHTGCEVEEWLSDEQVLYCPCHSSRFDPKDGARVVDGPAPRALPALPLALVDDKLVVAKPYTSSVGFESA
jgi:rieske iron-sulfur protein